MNPTVTSPTDRTPASPLRVEYYPSIDDCVYVAEGISAVAAGSPAFLVYVYYGFLGLNIFGIPMLLWFADRFLIGLLVFAFNLAAVLFLLPNVNKSHYKAFYRRLHNECAKHSAIVDLNDRGVLYSTRGNEFFFPWTNIIEVEETETSIHLHYEHNAISVQKTDFAYMELERDFLSFARCRVNGPAHREHEQLTKPVTW